MPKRGERKFTEFVYNMPDNTEVKIPVKIVTSSDKTTFRAESDALDISLSNPDINKLRDEVGALVKDRYTIQWTPYFYVDMALKKNYSPSFYYMGTGDRVTLTGILRGAAPDGSIVWLRVDLPRDIRTGDLETLAKWSGEVRIYGARPQTDPPPEGPSIDKFSGEIGGYACLLPVSVESIKKIRGLFDLEDAQKAEMLKGLKR